jgi:hypothetical protein
MNVASSALFLVPALAAADLPNKDVSVACLLCLFTSVCNHLNASKNETLRAIDQWVVRAIACVYVGHSLACMGADGGAPVTYILAGATLVWYAFAAGRSEVHHSVVHLLAVAGILSYVASRRALLPY